MSTGARLVLASASPRRRELLAQVGLVCEVRPTDVPEVERPGERPVDYVARVAREKLEAALETTPEGAVLAADTVVALGESLLQKPDGDAEGLAMLARLEGRAHEVHTAVALGVDGAVREVVVVTTRVHFRPLDVATRVRYVATGEGRDKAGGYGIQGVAGAFVERIEGSYSNVVGLPLAQTAELLARHGVAHVP